jgi:hypothetical protein
VIPVLTYTFARIALLAVVYGIGYLAGLRDLTLLVMAFLGSGVLSLVVLNRQRDAVGGRIAGFVARINDRIEANTRKEDVD